MGVFLILFYDLTMEKELPPYIYLAFAVIVFLGQTFDAIDGKHARNTGKSSPLGQLMDHGCDAFSNSFICIMVCQTTKFGGTIYTVLIQSLVQVNFCLHFLFYLYKKVDIFCLSMGRESNRNYKNSL